MTTERTPAQTDDLIRALGRQMNEARDALNELVEAAAESGEYEDDDPDPDENTLASLKNTVRIAVDLIDALKKLARGRTLGELHDAFGAPGEWGYETAFGEALSKFYRAESARQNGEPATE